MATQVPVPTAVTDLALLERVDYADSFSADTTTARSPEDWVRLALQSAPPGLLPAVRLVQQTLGIGLTRPDHEHPLGWTIARSDDDVFVLAADGDSGSARIICIAPPGRVVVTTQLTMDTTRRRMWRVIAPAHRAVARFLVDRARRAG